MTDSEVLWWFVGSFGISVCLVIGLYLFLNKKRNHKQEENEKKETVQGRNWIGWITIIAIPCSIWLNFRSNDKVRDGDEPSRINENVAAERKVDRDEHMREFEKSFNGVVFGAELNGQYGRVEKVDLSDDKAGIGTSRGFLGASGGHELSFWKTEYRPERCFRVFESGRIRASWLTKQIFGVDYHYTFPRKQMEAETEAEYKAIMNALIKKYGVNPETEKGFGGDEVNKFIVGNLIIELKYVKEGVLDHAAVHLEAERKDIKALAEKESMAYYNKKKEAAASRVRQGGEDAL